MKSKEVSVTDQLTKRQIARIVEKARAEKPLTRSETNQLARYELEQREDRFREHAQSVRQFIVLELLGTSSKVMGEWERQGMPRNHDRSKTYDLFAVLQWRNKRWVHGNGESPGNDKDSEHVERWQEYRADMLKLDLEEREEELIDRDLLRSGWGVAQAIVRKAGATLAKRYDSKAQDILDKALDDANAAVLKALGGER